MLFEAIERFVNRHPFLILIVLYLIAAMVGAP